MLYTFRLFILGYWRILFLYIFDWRFTSLSDRIGEKLLGFRLRHSAIQLFNGGPLGSEVKWVEQVDLGSKSSAQTEVARKHGIGFPTLHPLKHNSIKVSTHIIVATWDFNSRRIPPS